MAVDRAAARRRVRSVTGWAAAGAAVFTGAFAYGAARNPHTAKAGQQDDARSSIAPAPQQYGFPGGGSDGYTPPSSSTTPPAATSGGS